MMDIPPITNRHELAQNHTSTHETEIFGTLRTGRLILNHPKNPRVGYTPEKAGSHLIGS
jgi:hypothetical protein